MRRKIIPALLMVCAFGAKAQPIKQENIKVLISQMTLEEKVKMVVGAGMRMPGMGGAGVGSTEDKVPGAAGTSQAIDRLGIPKVVMADGPAGVRIDPKRPSQPDRTFYATGFPVATMLASSYNTALLEKVGQAFGNESKEYGVDILLAPGMNIHRNPLCGRNFEYYSEDPVVSGKSAAAFVRGVQSQGVGVSIKHFAANNQETNRTKVNTIVSQRALREIYLRGFEIAVKEANPWTVMSSYNKINEVYASHNTELLRTILREEWGFKGFVMTDWFGGEDAAQQMIAGNDLIMPGTPNQEQAILKAVKDGSLDEKILDRNIEAILNVYVNTLTYKGYKPANNPDFEAHKAVAKEAAIEGMVLLKNEKNTLPLSGLKAPAALLGTGSYETIAGGTGSGDVNKAYVVSIYEGMQKKGISLSAPLTTRYQQYIRKERDKMPPKQFFFQPDKVVPEMTWTPKQLDSLADVSSVGIYTLLRTSGEFEDRNLETDFNLTATELDLISKAAEAFHKKNKRFVVLLNIGGVIETASWKHHPDAILVVWQPGQEGGHAVADVLAGTTSPSGKLSMTFPVKYADVPSAKNFPGKELEARAEQTGIMAIMGGVKSEVVYEEDIYVGYRYYETFSAPVSYPFGFGLSYTDFSYSNLKINAEANGNIRVVFAIKNTGKAAGKEVAQVYVTAPASRIGKPSKELKAFAKTRLLKPGEQEQVEITLTPADLASFDEGRSAWVTDKGTYTISVGSSISLIRFQGKAEVKDERVTSVNKVLVPARTIEVLYKR